MVSSFLGHKEAAVVSEGRVKSGHLVGLWQSSIWTVGGDYRNWKNPL